MTADMTGFEFITFQFQGLEHHKSFEYFETSSMNPRVETLCDRTETVINRYRPMFSEVPPYI